MLHGRKPIFSEEGFKRLSQCAKDRGFGGYNPHPNRGSRYNGIWFDSNWEINVAKSLDKNGVKWERPTRGFVWNDKGNKYYPDFFLIEYNIYLDPKNEYLQVKHKEKIENAQVRNGIKVIMLNGNQLTWDVIQALIV